MIASQTYSTVCNISPEFLLPAHDTYQLVTRTLADSDCKSGQSFPLQTERLGAKMAG